MLIFKVQRRSGQRIVSRRTRNVSAANYFMRKGLAAHPYSKSFQMRRSSGLPNFFPEEHDARVVAATPLHEGFLPAMCRHPEPISSHDMPWRFSAEHNPCFQQAWIGMLPGHPSRLKGAKKMPISKPQWHPRIHVMPRFPKRGALFSSL